MSVAGVAQALRNRAFEVIFRTVILTKLFSDCSVSTRKHHASGPQKGRIKPCSPRRSPRPRLPRIGHLQLTFLLFITLLNEIDFREVSTAGSLGAAMDCRIFPKGGDAARSFFMTSNCAETLEGAGSPV